MIAFSEGVIGSLPRRWKEVSKARMSSSTRDSTEVLEGMSSIDTLRSDMPQSYHIRLATEDDLETIVELENALFDNAFGFWTMRQELRASRVYLLIEAGCVRGYAIVRADAELADLLRLGVFPHVQGKGYGKALLDHALAEVPGPMMLLVRKDNSLARDLYRTRGFKVVGTTDESWVMRRAGATSVSA